MMLKLNTFLKEQNVEFLYRNQLIFHKYPPPWIDIGIKKCAQYLSVFQKIKKDKKYAYFFEISRTVKLSICLNSFVCLVFSNESSIIWYA